MSLDKDKKAEDLEDNDLESVSGGVDGDVCGMTGEQGGSGNNSSVSGDVCGLTGEQGGFSTGNDSLDGGFCGTE